MELSLLILSFFGSLYTQVIKLEFLGYLFILFCVVLLFGNIVAYILKGRY